MPRPTPAARTIDLDPARNLSAEDADRRLYPGYGAALRRLPRGPQVFRGIPFDFGAPLAERRWVIADVPLTIDLGGANRASHLVVAHLCDSFRDESGERPAGVPLGHVVPVGQPLADYTIADRSGRSWRRRIRRRFEVNDGIVGWGSAPFAAVGHLDNEAIDWRGPHAVQSPGRYAPAGQSGSLTVMPGTYGGNQVGMTDLIPSPTGDVMVWLHSIALEPGSQPVALNIEPLAADRPGGAVVLVAVTLFDGTADPLARSPRFQILVGGPADRPLEVDLGTIIRTRPAPRAVAAPIVPPDSGGAPVVGWGTPRSATLDAEAGDRIVDLSVAPDALVAIDGWAVPGRALAAGATLRDPAGQRSIEVLAATDIPVEVVLADAAGGDRSPARVRFVAADGRYLPPDGHRDEVNPGFFEDTGADLILGGATYAYVPGAFSIHLPVGRVEVEAVAGFDRRPVRETVVIDPSTRRLEFAFGSPIGPRGDRWLTADSHVHFVAPSTALLQAAAEDVDVVNLLAAQWGDLYTNVTDVPWGSMADAAGRRRVIVGTENRQNMLGHLALLGARQPTLPLASGGPPEGRMGGPLEVLLADWADRCHAAGGLVVGAHFPLPYAEIAADIVAGKIDAIEAQALSPGLDDPTIVEWYRFLDLGYRLPIVAGTDKMSSEVPIGAVRTYTHLVEGAPPSFEGWANAVRAGRTFISSGPLIELAVEGREPGETVTMTSPGQLAFEARVRAAQPIVTDLEVLLNGHLVAATSSAGGATELVVRERVTVGAGSWIAARSRSRHEIQSAFTTSMASHTSPVYVEVADHPLMPSSSDADVVEQVILGARTWIADLAAVAVPADRERMVAFLDAAVERLRGRLSAHLD
ncbi:MAG: CehA/McbA family metallohydrolase [Candidatus Limnocylindrales bacterium]